MLIILTESTQINIRISASYVDSAANLVFVCCNIYARWVIGDSCNWYNNWQLSALNVIILP